MCPAGYAGLVLGHGHEELKGLEQIYSDIQTVNKHFVQRLQNIQIKDASLNAIITLDCFAMSINFNLTQNMMDDLRENFSVYLKDKN